MTHEANSLRVEARTSRKPPDRRAELEGETNAVSPVRGRRLHELRGCTSCAGRGLARGAPRTPQAWGSLRWPGCPSARVQSSASGVTLF